MAFQTLAVGRRWRQLVLAGGFLLTGCEVYDAALVTSAGSVPARPPAATSSPSDAQTLVFAFRNIDLDQGDEWATIGVNLDGLNTQVPDLLTECSSPTDARDGESGIDNKLGQSLLSQILETPGLGTLQCELDGSHARGRGTMLLRIDGWNGEADDNSVVATLASALDATSVDPAAVGELVWEGNDLLLEEGGAHAPDPCWLDPECTKPSQFFVNRRSYNDGDENFPKVRNSNAYIVDNMLVMPLVTADFELTMEQRFVPIIMSTGYLLASMNDDYTAVTRGVLAGRYPVTDMQRVGGSIGVCGGDFAKVYTGLADILATERAPGDPPNPDVPCNAISMGIGFEATAVTWAGLAPVDWGPVAWCETMPPPPAECL